jgi:flagellar basal body-associated protein FliL
MHPATWMRPREAWRQEKQADGAVSTTGLLEIVVVVVVVVIALASCGTTAVFIEQKDAHGIDAHNAHTAPKSASR